MMVGKTRTMILLVLATVAGMSLWFMTAAILPQISAEAGLSATQSAALSSAVQAGFVFGALTIAISGLADRLDPRHVLVACAVGTSLATCALLWVPLDGLGAIALRFVTGALMAGVYPVGMKIAVGWGKTDRGALVALLVAALTFGNSLPFGLAWLGGADWRPVLLAASSVAALGGFSALGTTLGPYHAAASAFRPSALTLAWKDPNIRGAYLGYFGHMWELFALWAWVGAAAAASYAFHLPKAEADSLGTLTAFACIAAGAPAAYFAGLWADRIGKARIATLAMIGSGSLAIATALAFGGTVWMVFALFVLWGVFVIPDSAQFSALVADHAPPEWTGSLLTLQTALGFLLTVLTVQVTPIIAEVFGWPTLLAVLAIGPALGVLAMRRMTKAEAQAGQDSARDLP